MANVSFFESAFESATQAYIDNADYQETNSTAKAKLFITAVRKLIGLRPSSGQHGGGESSERYQFDLRTLELQKKEAQSFLQNANILSQGSTVYAHFYND